MEIMTGNNDMERMTYGKKYGKKYGNKDRQIVNKVVI